jgi:hypothetical protein
MEQWVFSVFLRKMVGGPWLWSQRRSSLMRLELNLLKILFMLPIIFIIIYSLLFDIFFSDSLPLICSWSWGVPIIFTCIYSCSGS